MKKAALLSIVLAAVMMTACKKNEEEHPTAVSEETTILEITSVTEKTTVKNKENKVAKLIYPMEIITYNPSRISDHWIEKKEVEKNNNEEAVIIKDIFNSLQDIETARMLLSADSEIYDSRDFTDTETVLEGDETSPFVYKPFINTEIARTEDELFRYIRKYFTQKYINDDELRRKLFEEVSEHGNFPRYKTIDGKLCIRCGFDRAEIKIDTDKIKFITVSESLSYVRAKLYAYDTNFPPYLATIETEITEGQNRQLDELELTKFDQALCDVIYNGLIMRSSQLETVFMGRNIQEPKKIEIRGESYTETNNIEISYMRKLFKNTFAETVYIKDENDETTGIRNLCEYYTKKYIDDVYIEQGGVLYRRDSAIRWSLPYFEIDTDKNIGSGSRLGKFNAVVTIYDYHSAKEDFDISFYSRGRVEDGEEVIYDIFITSDLPIKEKGRAAKLAELNESILEKAVQKRLKELKKSEAVQGEIDIYSGNLYDCNNDGYNDYFIAYDMHGSFQLLIVDSQSGDILFDEKVNDTLQLDSKMSFYRNNNSEYAIKVLGDAYKSIRLPDTEKVHIVKSGEVFSFESRRDRVKEQKDLLEGYTHYTDIEWYEYTPEAE